MSLSKLLGRINDELTASVRPEPPCQELSSVPLALRGFYAESNGLQLPFLEIYPAQQIELELVPGWACFGFDGYFSYALCRETSIDLWDHEGDSDPEGAYTSVLELISATYKAKVENSDIEGKLVLSAAPSSRSTAELVAVLKSIDPRSTIQLFGALKNLPLEISCSRRDGVRAVRALHTLGATSRLSLTPNTLLERARDR